MTSIVLTAVALAAACALAVTAFDEDSAWLAPAVGLAAWLGFSLSTLMQHNGFEQKPARLTLINSAYQLALLVGMAAPIGLLQ